MTGFGDVFNIDMVSAECCALTTDDKLSSAQPCAVGQPPSIMPPPPAFGMLLLWEGQSLSYKARGLNRNKYIVY